MLQTSSTFRKPVRPRSEMVSSKGFVKKLKTKKAKPKPGWDSSVNDLSVYKPTDQELKRNHELHQPKMDHQRLQRKMESTDPAVSFDASFGGSFFNPESPFIARTGAMTKQKFCEQKREARALLAETDRTIIEMDEIMGNITHKYHSVPILTQAPRLNKDVIINDVSVLNPGDHLYYDDLTGSVGQPPPSSVNEKSDQDSSCNDENEQEINGVEETDTRCSNFEESMNMDRYQNLLMTESCADVDEKVDLQLTDMRSLAKEFTDLLNEKDLLSKPSHDGDSQEASEKTNLKMQKTKPNKSVTSKKEPCDTQATKATSLDTLTDLNDILKSLEKEIIEYEKETGKSTTSTKKFRTPSLVGGYTAHLLTMILRLTHHLKESELQLKTEMAMRKEIVDMYDDQRVVVDLLTQNILELQASNEELRKQIEDSNDGFKQQLQAHVELSQTQHSCLKKEFDDLEARFNVFFFNSDGGARMLRKPFNDLTNENMPRWADAEHLNK